MKLRCTKERVSVLWTTLYTNIQVVLLNAYRKNLLAKSSQKKNATLHFEEHFVIYIFRTLLSHSPLMTTATYTCNYLVQDAVG